MADVAGKMTPGRRAAVRKAKTQRGLLKLTQEELARAAGVSLRTVQNFEQGETWPQPGTLANLEKEGLGWPPGYLDEFAARYDENVQKQNELADRPRTSEWHQIRDDLRRLLDALNDEFPDSALPGG